MGTNAGALTRMLITVAGLVIAILAIGTPGVMDNRLTVLFTIGIIVFVMGLVSLVIHLRQTP